MTCGCAAVCRLRVVTTTMKRKPEDERTERPPSDVVTRSKLRLKSSEGWVVIRILDI